MGLTLTVRLARRWLGPPQVVEDEEGHRWARIAPAEPGSARQLLAEVREDLATLPPLPFRSKYRDRMTDATPALHQDGG